MLDIFNNTAWLRVSTSYPETWWEHQVEFWKMPFEQSYFLERMKEWEDANQTS